MWFAEAPLQESGARKRWVKLTPRDHVLKQIEAQETLVEELRQQLEKEEKTLQGMQKKRRSFSLHKRRELVHLGRALLNRRIKIQMLKFAWTQSRKPKCHHLTIC